MPASPIVQLESVRDWAPLREAQDDKLLRWSIQASSDLVERLTGLRVVAPTASLTENHDGAGDRCGGKYAEVLRLLYAPIQTLVSVKENGVLLTTAEGYSTTADVIVIKPKAQLHRRGSSSNLVAPSVLQVGWPAGVQNIEVVYKPGLVADAASVPGDLAQATIDVAWFLYNEPNRLQLASTGRAGKSAGFLQDLPPAAMEIIRSYRAWRQL